MRLLFTLQFDNMPPSLQVIYNGDTSRHSRNRLAQAWHLATKVQVRKAGVVPVTSFPVAIVTTITKKRPYDSINCALAAKLIEDGLVHAGVLPNDSPRYVSEHILRSRQGAQRVQVDVYADSDFKTSDT